MITQDEKNFLKTIPVSKKVSVKPFDPKAKTVGNSILSKIKREFPDLEVLFMGATALEIAGQNDIDIYALSVPSDFSKYLPTFEKLFGKPLHSHETFIEWKFNENNYPIELYLTDSNSSSMQRQIKVFKILKSNKDLLKEYKKLKSKFDGKSFKDYQKAKYKFYNNLLNKSN